jgi:hypothetical protein
MCKKVKDLLQQGLGSKPVYMGFLPAFGTILAGKMGPAV